MPTKAINGVTISFKGRGQGLPLVLLHAFPLDCRMWSAQVEEFSGRHRVIAPDYRGFGQSRPATPFTIESLADEVHALLESIGALPCVMGGLSMGGYVSLAYACKYPHDLRGLILADTRAEADTPDGKQNRQKMIELARTSGSKAVADQMEPKLLAPDTREHRPDIVKAMRAMADHNPPEAIEHALAAMRDRPDRIEELSSIAIPTLILVGSADTITPPSVAHAMHERIPRSQFVEIPGAGHLAAMEQPAQVNRAMRNFIENLR
jgi:pimeloyl-ACP methyl ester carboxylesterase